MPSERSPKDAGYSGTESTERGISVPTRGTRCCARKERRPSPPTSVSSRPCEGKGARPPDQRLHAPAETAARGAHGRPAPGSGGREHTRAASPPSAVSRAGSLQLARGRRGTRAPPAGRSVPARHAPPPPPVPAARPPTLTLCTALARDTPGCPTACRAFLPSTGNFCRFTFTSNGLGLGLARPPCAPAGAPAPLVRAAASLALPMAPPPARSHTLPAARRPPPEMRAAPGHRPVLVAR